MPWGSWESRLDHIPPERTKDVCYFNPADLRFPIAWNPLASIPPERHALARIRYGRVIDIAAAIIRRHRHEDVAATVHRNGSIAQKEVYLRLIEVGPQRHASLGVGLRTPL